MISDYVFKQDLMPLNEGVNKTCAFKYYVKNFSKYYVWIGDIWSPLHVVLLILWENLQKESVESLF